MQILNIKQFNDALNVYLYPTIFKTDKIISTGSGIPKLVFVWVQKLDTNNNRSKFSEYVIYSYNGNKWRKKLSKQIT